MYYVKCLAEKGRRREIRGNSRKLHNLTRQPTEADVVRAQNQARLAATWGKVWPVLSIVLVFTAIGLLIGFAFVGIAWTSRKAGESHPVNGIFPIRYIKTLAWRQWHPWPTVIVHDPNRSAGPTTIYSGAGAGDVVEVKQVMPDEIPLDQKQIAAGALLAQAASGNQVVARGMARKALGGRGGPTIVDIDVNERPQLLYDRLPEMRTYDPSHIQRLPGRKKLPDSRPLQTNYFARTAKVSTKKGWSTLARRSWRGDAPHSGTGRVTSRSQCHPAMVGESWRGYPRL